MGSLPTIRKAELPDAESIKASKHQSIKACVVAAYQRYILRMGQAPGPILDDYSQVVIRHQVFVVEESGPVIGGVVLVCNEEKMLLDNIAVQPNCQG